MRRLKGQGMAKHQPDYHSPLMALGKRALLWVVLPALLVVALLYSMATYKSPEQAEADRTARELKIDEALETRRRKV